MSGPDMSCNHAVLDELNGLPQTANTSLRYF